ncbi:Ohr subfamily peroxiredoxin [Glaciihabitans tibetensis]|uniref:Ohr subfamily peroxiredoxin n=1 Tax=Glaciihabitans tibetensis TaxID=1266600 RepID=A0A2T0VBG6_9MICO|nr:Ohr family peroxiredoxin [Glaciihabitans tibetensis]PRY67408.1 Ohr subfamily peroxiredoxin [Glaciihabitans tibetensis]
MSNAIYTAAATSWGGREGKVVTTDDRVNLDLSIPKEMGGNGGPGTNPEQLFASGWAACFHNAMKAIARSKKVDMTDSAVTLEVNVVGGMSAGFDFEVTINAQIPGIDPVVGQELLEAAHNVCPYSRATRGNIPVKLNLITDED